MIFKSLNISYNAAISRAVCAVRLHDKMGGTTIHANGQRVQRRSALNCYKHSMFLLTPLHFLAYLY